MPTNEKSECLCHCHVHKDCGGSPDYICECACKLAEAKKLIGYAVFKKGKLDSYWKSGRLLIFHRKSDADYCAFYGGDEVKKVFISLASNYNIPIKAHKVSKKLRAQYL